MDLFSSRKAKFGAGFAGKAIITANDIVAGAGQKKITAIVFFYPAKFTLGAGLVGVVFTPAFAAREATEAGAELDFFAGLD